jgi:diguanylate cyclase (GGDEF)-like protein/PAS domain S-box-containing protein
VRESVSILGRQVGLVMQSLALSEDLLKESEANFRLLFADNPNPMWIYDLDSLAFLEVNEAAVQRYGYGRDEFLAMTIKDIRPAEDVPELVRDIAGQRGDMQTDQTWRHRLKDGRVISVAISSHRLQFAGRPAALVLAQDVTERIQLDEQLRHQAFHDPLTQLANRALLRDRVEQALARNERRGGSCAVMFIDLDNFKAVNDSVGHTAGDLLLVQVAERLQGALRPEDTAARLGGDEFAVLLEHLGDERDAVRVAQRIMNALREPVQLEGDEWFVSASIGIALGGHDIDADVLLRNADVAMYDAKRRGRDRFGVFDPAMHTAVLDRLSLESDLRQALARDELSIAYQPEYEVNRRRMVAVEALVRWQHPTRGWVSPADFIPLAEDAGLIEQLDTWVLRTAARQVRAWLDAGIHPPAMAVNVSGKEFSNPGLAKRIAGIVAEVGLRPSHIELEVTESVAVNTEHAIPLLEELRAMGFRIAIDDFGVGQSMLSRLQEFPVNKLKIDRSFLQKVAFGEDEAPIVGAIIAMGHSLGLTVTAEGVETSEQLTFLRRRGCDEVQGFLLGRPQPAAEIERQLAPDRALSVVAG